MLSDMHIHIRNGYKDSSILKKYVDKAIEMGLSKVVFLEHGNRLSKKHSSILSNYDNIDIYKNTLNNYQDGRIKILSGIEIDYSDDLNFRKETIDLINYGDFDWVIGSIHSIKFENRCDYYYAIIDLIKNYNINCVGHIKLNDDYLEYKNILDNIVKIAHEKNVFIEINTSLRSRWNDLQLAFMLELMNKYGTKYTIGSDAHDYDEVGLYVYEMNKKIKRIGVK